MPAPAASAYTVAPRAFACSSDSSTRTAAPSPSTKPSRPLSHGREAAAGSSLRLDSAIMLPKAAIGSGCTAASVPPTTTTSARPSRIMSMPSAIASLPEAQAETGVCTPALAPMARPTLAAGRVGHQHRDRQRRDPARALLLERVVVADSSVCTPPMPEAIATPRRSGSTRRRRRRSDRQSAQASRAATRASWPERSRRRALTRSSTSVGSTATSAAIWVLSCSAQSCVEGVDPGSPVEQGGPGAGRRHRRRGRSCRVRSRRREWRSCTCCVVPAVASGEYGGAPAGRRTEVVRPAAVVDQPWARSMNATASPTVLRFLTSSSGM